MRLTRVLLENFGLFQGRNEIEVEPRGDMKAPIILFAGMNGAGKTTFLEAVQLALYGRAALGARVRQTDYELHLRNRVHRSRNGVVQPTTAAVGVEFDFSSAGTTHHYRIVRSWSLRNGVGAQERLSIECDQEAIKELDEQFFQDFIRELIPPGISQLFFFDGEKIQRIADDEEDALIADSIKSLLGLDLVERLKGDLLILRDRQLAQQGTSKATEALTTAEEALAANHQTISEKMDLRADLVAQLDGCDRELERSEQGLTRVGGKFATNRNALKEDKIRHESTVGALEKRIRELTETSLPFAFCPNLNRRLLARLNREQASRENKILEERSSSAVCRVRQLLATESLSESEWSLADRILAKVSHEIRGVDEEEDVSPIHQLSSESHRRIQSWLEDSEGNLSSELRNLGVELEVATRELQQVQLRMKQIPEEDAVRPEMEKLTIAMADRARIDQQVKVVDEELKELHLRRDALEREIRKHREKLEVAEHHQERVELLERCRKALEEYQSSLTLAKIQRLEHEVTHCFQKLLRKDDLVRNIRIDTETCHVSLYDVAGEQIPKSSLSAGEKQMYAVAILWGLARTSGRQLPLIIDTPLGRLDSKHRENLVERYFPEAAQQVIILSTDTEIDQDYYRALTPSISRSYRLEFDPESSRTHVHEGYFWKEEELCNA